MPLSFEEWMRLKRLAAQPPQPVQPPPLTLEDRAAAIERLRTMERGTPLPTESVPATSILTPLQRMDTSLATRGIRQGGPGVDTEHVKQLTRPLVTPEMVQKMPGWTQPVGMAARELTSPTQIALLLASAGLGPFVAGGIRGGTGVVGAVRGLAAGVLDPIVRGGFGARVAAEAGMGTTATLAGTETAKRVQNAPTPIRIGAPLVAGLAGGVGSLAAGKAVVKTAPALARGAGRAAEAGAPGVRKLATGEAGAIKLAREHVPARITKFLKPELQTEYQGLKTQVEAAGLEFDALAGPRDDEWFYAIQRPEKFSEAQMAAVDALPGGAFKGNIVSWAHGISRLPSTLYFKDAADVRQFLQTGDFAAPSIIFPARTGQAVQKLYEAGKPVSITTSDQFLAGVTIPKPQLKKGEMPPTEFRAPKPLGLKGTAAQRLEQLAAKPPEGMTLKIGPELTREQVITEAERQGMVVKRTPAPPAVRAAEAPAAAKEPWQMLRQEYEARGIAKLPETHTLAVQYDQLNKELRQVEQEMLNQAGWRKQRFDLATRRSTIGSVMEELPQTIATALKSPKVSKTLKERYRAVRATLDVNATDVERLLSHRTQIEQALSAGKPVPAEVLRDYPDLAAKAPAPAVETLTRGVSTEPARVVLRTTTEAEADAAAQAGRPVTLWRGEPIGERPLKGAVPFSLDKATAEGWASRPSGQGRVVAVTLPNDVVATLTSQKLPQRGVTYYLPEDLYKQAKTIPTEPAGATSRSLNEPLTVGEAGLLNRSGGATRFEAGKTIAQLEPNPIVARAANDILNRERAVVLPSVVYHGGPQKQVFDFEQLRLSTRADSSQLGYFFSPTKLEAEHYAGKTGQVGAFRLESARTYVMQPEEFRVYGSRQAFRDARQRLLAEGYDVVHIPHLNEYVAISPDVIKPAGVAQPPSRIAPTSQAPAPSPQAALTPPTPALPPQAAEGRIPPREPAPAGVPPTGGKPPTGATPPGGGVPPPKPEDFAANIRLSKYPRDLRATITAWATNHPTEVQAARRGVRPDAQVLGDAQKLVEDMGGDFAKLQKKWKPGDAWNAEEVTAIRGVLRNKTQTVVDAGTAVRTANTTENQARLMVALEEQARVQEIVHGATAESGRALRAFRQEAFDAAKAGDVERFNEILRRFKGRADIQDIAKKLAEIDTANPAAVNQFIRNVTKPKFWDYIMELYYNSILSGPKTHIINALSNTITTAISPVERFGGAVTESVLARLQGRARQRFFGEVMPDAVGAIEGMNEGVRSALSTMKHGFSPTQATKYEFRPRAFKGKLGRVINFPSTALEAADAMNRAINYRAALNATAVRTAKAEGLTGQVLLDRIADLKMNPSAELTAEASRVAEYRLFRQPAGTITTKVMALRDAVPGLTFVIPFLRTPVNIAKFGLERSPAGLLNPRLWRNLAAKNPEAADQLARVFMGSTIGGTLGWYGAQGRITGAVPSNASERDRFYREGKQPFSLRIGNRWVQYQRLEPLNQTLSLVATVIGAVQAKDKTVDERARMAVETISQNLVSQTYVSSISDLINAIADPERYGTQFFERQAASIALPFSSALRTAAQVADPTFRQPENIAERVESQVPGLSRRVPARLTAFGEEAKRETPAWSPIVVSPAHQDAVDAELERLGINIGFVGETIGGVPLTREQQYAYQQLAGQMVKKALARLVQRGYYKGASDDRKEYQIRRAVDAQRAAARKRKRIPTTPVRTTPAAPSGPVRAPSPTLSPFQEAMKQLDEALAR